MENTENKKNPSSRTYIIIIAVLALAVTFLVIDKFMQKHETKIIIQKLETSTNQKDSIERDLKNLLGDYENLKSTNTKINSELTAQQEKIEKLLTEVRTIKASNFQKIDEYKKQVETLRTILRSYIVQIDSLNTTNKKLVAENKEVKANYDNIKTEKDDLVRKSDSLTNTVAIASVLKAMNLQITALNARGTETTRVSKVDKIRVCLALAENPVARKGSRDVIIRISGPDKKVLLNDKSGFFRLGSEDIAFSSKREVEYIGKDLDVCVFYAVNKELGAGIYTIDVFSEGAQIGTTTVNLK